MKSILLSLVMGFLLIISGCKTVPVKDIDTDLNENNFYLRKLAIINKSDTKLSGYLKDEGENSEVIKLFFEKFDFENLKNTLRDNYDINFIPEDYLSDYENIKKNIDCEYDFNDNLSLIDNEYIWTSDKLIDEEKYVEIWLFNGLSTDIDSIRMMHGVRVNIHGIDKNKVEAMETFENYDAKEITPENFIKILEKPDLKKVEKDKKK